jgi:putative ABC transport system ATP-binding protein
MSDPVELRQRNDVIVVDDVHMIYRVGRVGVPALSGVDMTVREGEFVAVMGPSGCGKSTLLHLMGGLLSPTRGRVRVDGTELTSISDSQRTEVRRRKVGFVFQRLNLLPTLTAMDNLNLAREIRENGQPPNGLNATSILALLGLENKIHHKPTELSGGEQQRVAIARAIITRPKILLADEPTGSLDSENSGIVLEMLQELNMRHGQTILLITHDPDVAATAGRIVEMRDGKILNRVENLYYAREQKHLY